MAEFLARLRENATDGWFIWGMFGQTLFASRFLVQWIVSERAQRSIIPVSFWYISLGGSFILLTYALFGRQDPVIVLGQSFGFIVYLRNLALIGKHRREGGALSDSTGKAGGAASTAHASGGAKGNPPIGGSGLPNEEAPSGGPEQSDR